jgi:hypothetical protein
LLGVGWEEKAYTEVAESAEVTEKRKIGLRRVKRSGCNLATIPPLRGPTRQKTARKRKSGRFGRDDKLSQMWMRGSRRRWKASGLKA